MDVVCFFFTELVPAQAEKELRHLYLALSELLRHFWHSFPATTPELEAKAVHMHEALQRFEGARLHPFEVSGNIDAMLKYTPHTVRIPITQISYLQFAGTGDA